MPALCRLLAGGALLLLAGCAAEEPAPWRVEVNGCATWTKGPVCAIGEENLRIWIEGDEIFRIEIDGNQLVLGPKLAGGGQQFELTVPSTARLLRIRRDRGGSPFELDLQPSIQPSWYAQAMELAREGDEKGALALVAREAKDDLVWTLNAQARIAYLGDRRQDAVELARRSAALFLDQGRPGSAVHDLIFAAHLLAVDAFYPESRVELEKAETIVDETSGWPVLPVRMHYLVGHQRAVLAHFTGDVRNALASLDRIAVFDQEHQLLSDDEISDRVQMGVNVLADLGRFREAGELLDALEDLSLSEDRRADLQLNRGWIALLARQEGRAAAEDPKPFLDAAWDYYRQETRDQDKFNVQLNLASAAAFEGRLEAAREHLELASSFRAAASAREDFLFRELRARLSLLEGKPQAALDEFRRLEADQRLRYLPDARWMALIGTAESYAALGQREAAVAAFESAESLESHELMVIPLDQGRETFVARRERTTRQHLELLLDQHQDRALELVRRRRVQVLALLQRDERVAAFDADARRGWDEAAAEIRRRQRRLEEKGDPGEVSTPRESRTDPRLAARSDQFGDMLDAALAKLGLSGDSILPASRPGELTLAFFPRERSWLIFALDGEHGLEIEEKEVSPDTPLEAVAAELLALVEPQILACRRIRILSRGGLDFHALPFKGQALVAVKPVVYGVDVGRAGKPDGSAGARRVVLVADQTKLTWAQTEIELAEKMFAGRAGFRLEVKLLNREAKPEIVRRALERADFFHFAGHGEFDQAGSQSRLQLSGGELRAGDVFTLEKVPAQVLLSSCHVGRAARASGVEGLGLAYAFVLAGSRQVLAATREVNDRDTAKLIRALYAHIEKTPGEIDLAASLREAQLELAKEKGRDAWKAFRVFEP